MSNGVYLDFQEPVILQQQAPVQQAPAPEVQTPVPMSAREYTVHMPQSARSVEVDSDTLAGALEIANRALALAGTNTSLRHTIHEATNQFYISLINNETNEVIREIPPRSSLDRFAAILELAGLLVDQRQ